MNNALEEKRQSQQEKVQPEVPVVSSDGTIPASLEVPLPPTPAPVPVDINPTPAASQTTPQAGISQEQGALEVPQFPEENIPGVTEPLARPEIQSSPFEPVINPKELPTPTFPARPGGTIEDFTERIDRLNTNYQLDYLRQNNIPEVQQQILPLNSYIQQQQEFLPGTINQPSKAEQIRRRGINDWLNLLAWGPGGFGARNQYHEWGDTGLVTANYGVIGNLFYGARTFFSLSQAVATDIFRQGRSYFTGKPTGLDQSGYRIGLRSAEERDRFLREFSNPSQFSDHTDIFHYTKQLISGELPEIRPLSTREQPNGFINPLGMITESDIDRLNTLGLRRNEARQKTREFNEAAFAQNTENTPIWLANTRNIGQNIYNGITEHLTDLGVIVSGNPLFAAKVAGVGFIDWVTDPLTWVDELARLQKFVPESPGLVLFDDLSNPNRRLNSVFDEATGTYLDPGAQARALRDTAENRYMGYADGSIDLDTVSYEEFLRDYQTFTQYNLSPKELIKNASSDETARKLRARIAEVLIAPTTPRTPSVSSPIGTVDLGTAITVPIPVTTLDTPTANTIRSIGNRANPIKEALDAIVIDNDLDLSQDFWVGSIEDIYERDFGVKPEFTENFNLTYEQQFGIEPVSQPITSTYAEEFGIVPDEVIPIEQTINQVYETEFEVNTLADVISFVGELDIESTILDLSQAKTTAIDNYWKTGDENHLITAKEADELLAYTYTLSDLGEVIDNLEPWQTDRLDIQLDDLGRTIDELDWPEENIVLEDPQTITDVPIAGYIDTTDTVVSASNSLETGDLLQLPPSTVTVGSTFEKLEQTLRNLIQANANVRKGELPLSVRELNRIANNLEVPVSQVPVQTRTNIRNKQIKANNILSIDPDDVTQFRIITKAQLVDLARQYKLPGYSKLSKRELFDELRNIVQPVESSIVPTEVYHGTRRPVAINETPQIEEALSNAQKDIEPASDVLEQRLAVVNEFGLPGAAFVPDTDNPGFEALRSNAETNPFHIAGQLTKVPYIVEDLANLGITDITPEQFTRNQIYNDLKNATDGEEYARWVADNTRFTDQGGLEGIERIQNLQEVWKDFNTEATVESISVNLLEYSKENEFGPGLYVTRDKARAEYYGQSINKSGKAHGSASLDSYSLSQNANIVHYSDISSNYIDLYQQGNYVALEEINKKALNDGIDIIDIGTGDYVILNSDAIELGSKEPLEELTPIQARLAELQAKTASELPTKREALSAIRQMAIDVSDRYNKLLQEYEQTVFQAFAEGSIDDKELLRRIENMSEWDEVEQLDNFLEDFNPDMENCL